MVEFDVKKQVNNKPNIKRIELEYKDLNYIIINLEESVIDVNGSIYEYASTNETINKIKDMVWELDSIDEFDFWPDKTKDHPPMEIMWRLAFYDEFDRYYHKSGVIKYPDKFMDLVGYLKKLK